MSNIFQNLSSASKVVASPLIESSPATRSRAKQVSRKEEAIEIPGEIISPQKVKEFLEQLPQTLRISVDTPEHSVFAEIAESDQALHELSRAASRYAFVEILRKLARRKIISPANSKTGTPEQHLLFTWEQRQELLNTAKKLYPKEPEIGRIWA